MPSAFFLEQVDAFAEYAHRNQRRKCSGIPYIVHPRAVAVLVKDAGLDIEIQAAALLHDTIEDSEVTAGLIDKLFGPRVARLVVEVTDVSKKDDGNRAVRKALDREHLAKASPEGMSIKLADLIDNTSTILSVEPGFAAKYLAEKRLLLPHLVRGHPGLFAEASKLAEYL